MTTIQGAPDPPQRDSQAAEPARARSGGDDGGTVRSAFLASMGHTLRTPLNGILGFSDILLEEAFGPLNERQRKYVEQISASGQRQLGLINNLIDLARFHAGQVEPEWSTCDANGLVEDAVAPFCSPAAAAQVDLEVHTGQSVGEITADAERLKRAVGNLLDNAVRSTDAGGTITVTVRRGSGERKTSQPEEVLIEVADTGAGIPPEDQGLLFDDCEHADSLAARRERRSGTGLALARRIVELHGGRIWVESEGVGGQGSKFVVALPSQPLGGE